MSQERVPSAAVQAELLGFEIADREQQIAAMQADLVRLQRQQGNWARGARGEQDVVRALAALAGDGYRVLADRRWPGRRRANLDVLVVGPGGVAVVDVKAWSDARFVDGRLVNGSHDATDDVIAVAEQAAAVDRELAEIGLPPADVVPMLVLAGRRGLHARLGRVLVLGEGDLPRALLTAGARLTPAQVERTARLLDEVCPPMPQQSLLDRVRAVPGQRPRERSATATPAGSPPDDDAMLTWDDVHAAVRQAAEAGPIEAWMAWLHPDQARLVARRPTGASRIRGAAGTGKTVVALHRAKLLAAEGRRVLFTSYVRTVPAVAGGVFHRLAPGLDDRVTFRSLYAVAFDVLRQSGSPARLDAAAAQTCFARAWGAVGRDSVLASVGVPYEYWRDEVVGLIGGRDVTDSDAYARLARTGRETRLTAVHRQAVWALHERYSELKAERGVHDHTDVLRLARDAAQGRLSSDGSQFDAVVVDEVQDLTTVGLQLLRALVGDRPEGLLLVGDGRQSVYPAALSLADAGVDVRGRSVVLRRNYRNGAVILAYALAVVAGDPFDDLEDGPGTAAGADDVETDRPGGEVVEARCTDDATTAMALCSRIEDLCLARGVRYGDVAVLVPTNADAAVWLTTLRRNGIPAMPLAEYEGVTCDRVKVGTFHRSKGLEFAHVLVPDRDRCPAPRRVGESEDAFAERAARERRTLLVALTRARDGVWVSTRT